MLLLKSLKLALKLESRSVQSKPLGSVRTGNRGLQDLAVLTGGQVITEELGMNLDDVELDILGSCKKITISKDDTVILDGSGEKKSIEKDASRSAVEKGLLPGGGVALLYAAKELEKLPTANFNQKIGVQIFQNALKTPVYTLHQMPVWREPLWLANCWNQKIQTSDMMQLRAGIIDPLKVIRTVLVDAASVSSLMTTTEAIVVEQPTEVKAGPPMGGGGMGGMDY
ncbi:hypothetical protein SASPL_101851 [Salvia splendens]|uniref:Chaperonin GroEL n=1 Tax=Salvia splendens TaxID=180675 RepID=A0A8X8YSH5_SALSN|nr:hypothetical protein SASPL_101851 [Salvia splendens]